MTQQKHLKQRIRQRQQKTGENYTTARSQVLAQLKKTRGSLQPQDTLVSSRALTGAKAEPASPSTVDVPTHAAPATSLEAWVQRNRLDAEPLRQLEQTANRIVQGVMHTDMSMLAACAKAVLISEMVDRAPRRHRYPQLPCEALRVTDEHGELEITPSDYTPMSGDLVHHALEVAAAFSGEDCQILDNWPVGRLSGATPQGRKAAVRFLRLMGARVIVVLVKGEPETLDVLPASMPSQEPSSNLHSTGGGKPARLRAQLEASRAPEPIAHAGVHHELDEIHPHDLHRFIGQPVRVVFVEPNGGFTDTPQGPAAVWYQGTTEPSTLLAYDRRSVTVKLPSQKVVRFENYVAVRAC